MFQPTMPLEAASGTHDDNVRPQLVNGGILILSLSFLHEFGFPKSVRLGSPIRFMKVDVVVSDQILGFRKKLFYRVRFQSGANHDFNAIAGLHQQWIMENGL